MVNKTEEKRILERPGESKLERPEKNRKDTVSPDLCIHSPVCTCRLAAFPHFAPYPGPLSSTTQGVGKEERGGDRTKSFHIVFIPHQAGVTCCTRVALLNDASGTMPTYIQWGFRMKSAQQSPWHTVGSRFCSQELCAKRAFSFLQTLHLTLNSQPGGGI